MAPTPNKTRRFKLLKRILLLFLTGVLLAAFVVLSLPFWLGFAFKLATSDEQVHFDEYKRNGFSEFQLEGLAIEHPQATIHIDRLKAFTPAVWFLKARQSDTDTSFLRIETLTVTLPEDPPRAPKGETSSGPQNISDALALLEKVLTQTDTWLPHASIGQIQILQGSRQLEIMDAQWADRRLSFTGQLSDYPDYRFNSVLNFQAMEPVLEVLIPDADLALNATLIQQKDSYIASARIRFRENAAILSSRFTKQSWIPESATWTLQNWSLNLETLGVTSPYPLLNFSLIGGWDQNGINNTLDGSLPSATGSDGLIPPIDFQSEIGGDFESLTVSRLSVDAPGLTARMTEPVVYELSSRAMTGDLRLDIDFDLALLKRDDLQGQLVGFLDLREQAGNPSGQFTLQGNDVKLQSFEFETLDIQARLDWPELEIQTLDGVLTTGTQAHVTGQVDLESRELITAALNGILTREILSDVLPEDLSLGTVSFQAEASGPFNAITHQGSLTVASLETPTLMPLSASVKWAGTQETLESVQLMATSETGELSLKGAGQIASGPMTWEIQELQLDSHGDRLASLEGPAYLTIDPKNATRVTIESLTLAGPGGVFIINGDVAYPDSATVKLEVENLDPQVWTSPWLKQPAPSLTIYELSANGGWDNGPARFDLGFKTTVTQEENPITAQGNLSSDGVTIEFENIEISDQAGPWVNIAGVAPIRIHPGHDPIITISKDEAIDLQFTSTESQNWLDWLSGITPFDFEKFKSQIQLQGALNDLTGNFEVELLTLASPAEHGMPATSVRALGTIQNTLLTISNMAVAVAEERFNMRGSIKLPTTLINKLDDPDTEVPWEETVFNLKIPPSKLTPLRYLAPQLLSTGGEIEADFTGSITEGIAGYFRIKDVNTRAIFPFGSLREISADLAFEKSQAKLRNISAFIGREPVTVTGTLDYRNWKDPTYRFTIKGSDLPLIRKPGLLLRSDLDLAITKETELPTTVTGQVGLKNGLFLLNRNTILGGGSAGGRTAKTRPPFFSIEAPPLSDWNLDLAVTGDRFIRVRTPAADGTLSLDMKLQGKLKEPFATGRLEFDEGNLYFPFSSFTVDYGIAELPVGDPYTPTVEMLGSSRRFGYDISVEITGSAYDPQVHFSSSPPLSSEQIMLMVMAGENPDGMFDYSGTQRASKLGTYISKGLFASGESGGSFLSRLSLDSGENLSEQGKETMEIEYLINDQFQLVGEYDEYDFWNAGLRWRILQRKVLSPEPEEVKE